MNEREELLAEFRKPDPPKRVEPRALPTCVKNALTNRNSGVDSAQLLTDLVDVWGGTRQLAQDLRAEFVSAPKGGQTRQRILEMIQRLIVTNTTHDIGKSTSPSDLTDDELQAKLEQYVDRILKK